MEKTHSAQGNSGAGSALRKAVGPQSSTELYSGGGGEASSDASLVCLLHCPEEVNIPRQVISEIIDSKVNK